MNLIRRTGYARPWPEGEPTRPGARCPMSDLLTTECDHCRPKKSDDHTAEPLDLDFS